MLPIACLAVAERMLARSITVRILKMWVGHGEPQRTWFALNMAFSAIAPASPVPHHAMPNTCS
jgi:hypothetical protein